MRTEHSLDDEGDLLERLRAEMLQTEQSASEHPRKEAEGLGADPETRYQTSGDAITNIRLATTDKWKDKASGEMKEATEWHRVAFFGRLAEIAGEYLKKGSQVYIEGRIRTRKYQDKEGHERYRWLPQAPGFVRTAKTERTAPK